MYITFQIIAVQQSVFVVLNWKWSLFCFLFEEILYKMDLYYNGLGVLIEFLSAYFPNLPIFTNPRGGCSLELTMRMGMNHPLSQFRVHMCNVYNYLIKCILITMIIWWWCFTIKPRWFRRRIFQFCSINIRFSYAIIIWGGVL